MKSEAFLAVADPLPEPMLLLSAAGVVLAANSAFARRLARQARELRGRRFADLVADPPAKIADYLRACARSRELLPGSFSLPAADGNELVWHCQGALAWPRSEDAEATLLLRFSPKAAALASFSELNQRIDALSAEIQRRQQTEAALHEGRVRLQGILDSAMDAIITVDANQHITLFNRRAEQMFGCLAADVLGQPLDRFVPEHARLAHRDHIRRFGQGDVASRAMGQPRTLLALRADGTAFPIEATISQVLVGEQQLYTAIVRDTTERMRAEDERRALERKMLETQKLESLGVLAGGIAHDFNNLLQTIRGNADLALRDLPHGTEAKQNIAHIELAAQRAAELIDQLLAYSGTGRFVVKPIDVGQLVREMAALLGASIPKHVGLRYLIAPGLPSIAGDANQIRQLVMNLIVNAAEAIGPEPGSVTCSLDLAQIAAPATLKVRAGILAARSYLRLDVKDTGSGMNETIQARIFEPFFTTKFTGRGLGLAAVLGIVQRHQGGLGLTSAPGAGTTVSVFLPISPLPAAEAPPAPTIAGTLPSHARGIVLVVDDEASVRQVIGRMLQRDGFTVLEAGDGLAGLELFRVHAQEISCVLLDMTMPHMSGERTAREIRDLRPGARVVLMSGYSAQEITTRFGGREPIAFLHKPFSPAELRAVIAAALAQ
jgi:PAS domain S-box-containing protein